MFIVFSTITLQKYPANNPIVCDVYVWVDAQETIMFFHRLVPLPPSVVHLQNSSWFLNLSNGSTRRSNAMVADRLSLIGFPSNPAQYHLP